MKKIPIVAIVGRANVGKSTLFNQIVGHRVAVVRDEPGVTRDRNYLIVSRHGFNFTLVDTGGLTGDRSNELQLAVRSQAEIAIAESDLILAVFDGLNGLSNDDYEVARVLRESGKPVIWIVNKCEKPKTITEAQEFYALGMDDIITLSAAHGIGIKDLIFKIKSSLAEVTELSGTREELVDNEVCVAFLGRPNVGKSSLVNRLVGADRLVVASLAGTTRDSIDVLLTREGQNFRIVDTAGLRKRAKVQAGSSERYGNLRSLKALVRSDVVVLVVDATEGVGDQENKIAGIVSERGKGLVIVVNKWDLIEKDGNTTKDYEAGIRAALPFASYAPILFVSAKSGKRCPDILKHALEVTKVANERLSTSKVNELLQKIFAAHPPPAYRGIPVKLLYATQVSVAPPAFCLFVNSPKKISATYERYIKNSLREFVPFMGSDIKLIVKKKNERSAKSLQTSEN